MPAAEKEVYNIMKKGLKFGKRDTRKPDFIELFI
jgi:hypothetical protein